MINNIQNTGSYMTSIQSQQRPPKPDPAHMFQEIDTDGDGGINQTELTTMAEKFSEMSGQTIDVENALSTYDADGDGSLSQEEMKTFMEENVPPPDFAQGMPGMQNMAAHMFKQIDTDGDGGINQAELTSMAEAFNEMTGNTIDVEGAIDTYDTDGDGSLSQEEMKAFMEENVPPPDLNSGMQGMQNVAANSLMDVLGNSEDEEEEDAVFNLDQAQMRMMAQEFSDTTKEFMGVDELMSAYDSDEDGVLNQDELETMMNEMPPPPPPFAMQQAISAYSPTSYETSFGATA